MTIDVNEVEAVWAAINLVSAVLAFAALRDALADRAAIRALNGKAREIVVSADVRRARVRLLLILGLVAVAVPAMLRPGPSSLTIGLAIVMAIPIVLLIDGLLDTRERRALTGAVLKPKAPR